MPQLPMVRLSLIAPFITQLSREGIDATATLAGFGVAPAQLEDAEAFVTSAVMYQLVESLSDFSIDPNIAVHLGESLDPLKFGPLSWASQHAKTVFDALLYITQDAQKNASSIEFSIHVRPHRTNFRAVRQSHHGILPRHNDGFTIGYLLAMLRTIVGESWGGRHVLLRLCDPEVLPQNYLGCRQAKSDSLGISIEFPTAWLQLSRTGVSPCRVGMPATQETGTGLDTLTAFRKMVSPHLNEKDLTLERVAAMFRVSPSTLKRRLSDHNTTLGTELTQLRKRRALQMLHETDAPIGEIASELGFSDASVFARSFRRWTGHSPSSERSQE